MSWIRDPQTAGGGRSFVQFIEYNSFQTYLSIPKQLKIISIVFKWVPVTTAWRVFGLQMEKAANILNKQSLTADKGWSFILGVG
jgi:hypothetical protein